MMLTHTLRLRVEQAVYGSFPFWERGYAILAQSAGCRGEWIEEFRAACERFGERPRGVEEAEGLFAFRLKSGPWAVVGVSESGSDDRGRPGALAFHAFFVRPRDYRRLGGWPFALARFHRRDWGPEPQGLDAVVLEVEAEAVAASEDPRADRIAEAVWRGRRVAVESGRPIEPLAREVWGRLPVRVRLARSLATWAFGNANRFDLVGLPSRAGVILDGSTLTLEEREDSESAAPIVRNPRRFGHWLAWIVGGLALVIGSAGLWWSVVTGGGRSENRVVVDSVAKVMPIPPDRDRYRGDPLDDDPELRERVVAGLVELAERFGVIAPGRGGIGQDPSALMERIADRLRYRGPLLSADELASLRSMPAAGRSRALAWDEQIRRFVPDRPLPTDFASGPLRWQLDTLAWSFHLPPDPRLAPAELPHALGHALAVEGSARSNPLTDRYPALGEYERFLLRLPRQ